MAGKPDPYEGIDFEEISEATGLAVDEIKCLKVFTLLINYTSIPPYSSYTTRCQI